MKNTQRLSCLTAALLVIAGTASPQTANISQLEPQRIDFQGDDREMSLADVVLEAFERNLDIEIRLIETEIADNRITQEKGIYDPTAEASATFNRTKTESTSLFADVSTLSQQAGQPQIDPDDLFIIEQDSTTISGGVSQLIPTGATLRATIEQTRTDIYDSRAQRSELSPNVTQALVLGIRQPLLKNFGPDVTNLGIRVAEKQRIIAGLLYQQEVIDRMADVMRAYWNLVFAVENLEVQRSSLAAAAELERVNQLRVETGAAARAELLRARAQRADRQNLVIQAKSQILDAQDALLNLLNWRQTGQSWDNRIVPEDRPENYSLDFEVADDLAIATAIDERPDYSASAVEIEIAELNLDVAKQRRLPELNAIGDLRFNGVNRNSSDAFDDVYEGDLIGYTVGAEFRYPILNRRARGEFLEAERVEQQARRRLERTELNLVTQVRAATRAIRTAQEAIEASLAQVEAAEETLSAEQKRLEVGSSTTFEVLDAQEDLAAAEVNLVRARVDYQLGLIDLYRSQGTLLAQIGEELGVIINFEDKARIGETENEAE